MPWTNETLLINRPGQRSIKKMPHHHLVVLWVTTVIV
jgi:hypothetical protein